MMCSIKPSFDHRGALRIVHPFSDPCSLIPSPVFVTALMTHSFGSIYSLWRPAKYFPLWVLQCLKSVIRYWFQVFKSCIATWWYVCDKSTHFQPAISCTTTPLCFPAPIRMFTIPEDSYEVCNLDASPSAWVHPGFFESQSIFYGELKQSRVNTVCVTYLCILHSHLVQVQKSHSSSSNAHPIALIDALPKSSQLLETSVFAQISWASSDACENTHVFFLLGPL